MDEQEPNKLPVPIKRGRGRPKGTTGIAKMTEREAALAKVRDIKSIARSHTETAIRTLSGIMVSEKSPAPARVAAATELLNRGWGKATQHIGGDEEAGPIVFRWLTAGDEQ